MASKTKPSKRDAMSANAGRVPEREMPDWIVRLLAHFISDMNMIAHEVGKRKNISNEKSRRVLDRTLSLRFLKYSVR